VFGVHEPAWLSRKTSVGYWLAPPFERRGLITDATRVVVTRLFREWEMHRVEIHVARDNTRSAAVALRLGFKEEALLREAVFANGRYHDMRVFAMLAREWPHDPLTRTSPLDAR
jgi:ribosomal-protein-serine acetyltransferase